MPSKLRGEVGTARTGDGTGDTDTMRNLAYVVSSANDNIQALQRTVKQQEKELSEKSDQAAALQRNYETLARIRQADQNEFMQLKARQAEEQALIKKLQAELSAARVRCEGLESRLEETEGAQARIERLTTELRVAESSRDEYEKETRELQRSNNELAESNRTLNASVDKLTRAQQEMLARGRKLDESMRVLEGEKEAGERAHAGTSKKLETAEKQLKTFLEANEALEADLRKQMARVAQLERRKHEQDAEQQTIVRQPPTPCARTRPRPRPWRWARDVCVCVYTCTCTCVAAAFAPRGLRPPPPPPPIPRPVRPRAARRPTLAGGVLPSAAGRDAGAVRQAAHGD